MMHRGKVLKSQRIIAVIFVLIFFAQTLNAMMHFISNDQLVKQAEHIVLAIVKNVNRTDKTVQRRRMDAAVMRNELEVIESIKGSLRSGDSFSMNTLNFDGWMEDNVELPAMGRNALLFLRKNEKGDFVPVNGIHGVWSIGRDGKPRYGTINEIRKLVHKEKGACESSEFNSLVDRAEIETQAGHYKDALDSYRKAYGICPMKDLEEQMAWLMGEAGDEENDKNGRF